MKGSNGSFPNTKKAANRNKMGSSALNITYGKLETEFKGKCASIDATRAHFLQQKQRIIPYIALTNTTQLAKTNLSHNFNKKFILPPVSHIETDLETNATFPPRRRAVSDLITERRSDRSWECHELPIKSHSTGTLHSSSVNFPKYGTAAQRTEDRVKHRREPHDTLPNPKVRHASYPFTTEHSRRLKALDLPFNQHIVHRKEQSEKDLSDKLNAVRHLRYLRSGKYTSDLEL